MDLAYKEKMIGAAALFAAFAYFGATMFGLIG